MSHVLSKLNSTKASTTLNFFNGLPGIGLLQQNSCKLRLPFNVRVITREFLKPGSIRPPPKINEIANKHKEKPLIPAKVNYSRKEAGIL